MRRRRRIRRNLWLGVTVILVVSATALGIRLFYPSGGTDQNVTGSTPTPTLSAERTPDPEDADSQGGLISSGETATPTPTRTPSPTPTPIPTPEPTPVKLKYPYYVEVDRGKQVVTVYTLDEFGEYRHIAREMICSTDTFNRKPPNGIYRLDGEHKRWLTTVATPQSYAQYATRIASKILFHSIPYKTKSPNDMDTKAYNDLGTNASIGCIRLLCEDAKWIYENLPTGTPIRFLTSPRDEDLLERLKPPPLGSGKWDPTDPDERNPDYNGSYTKPEVTPWLGVTPAPTPSWKAATYK